MDNQERLIDQLLREELGGETPPNLTEQIMRRAKGGAGVRWLNPLRWPLPALVAATVVLGILCGLVLAARMYREQAPQQPEIVKAPPLAEKAKPAPDVAVNPKKPANAERGAEIVTANNARSLALGVNNYCQVEVRPHSSIILAGYDKAEEIQLKKGEVRCKIDRSVGEFAVKTSVGVASVTGTEFTVRVPEPKGGSNMQAKKMLVKVLVGTVVLSGVWGSTPLAAGEDGGVVVGTVSTKGETWLGVRAENSEEMTMYMPFWKGGTPAQGGGFDKEMLNTIKGIALGSKVRLTFKMDEHARIVSVETLEAPPAEKPREVAAADGPKHGDGDGPRKIRDGEGDGPRKMREGEGDGPRKMREGHNREAENMGGERSGTFVGVVVGKGEMYLEVQADKDSPAKRFMPRFLGTKGEGGLDKEMLRQFQKVKINEWVKIEWTQDEHLRAVKLIQAK